MSETEWTLVVMAFICLVAIYIKVNSLSGELKDIRDRLQVIFDQMKRYDEDRKLGADNLWDALQDLKRSLGR